MKQAPYFANTWASNISVQADADHLTVAGMVPLQDSEIERNRDPYLGYVSSVKSQFGQTQSGKDSPHIKFANALDDDKLTAFVRTFGPVVSSQIAIEEPTHPEGMTAKEQLDADWHCTIKAVQTLATLREEQRIYAAALRLIIELKRGKTTVADAVLQYVTTIADGVWEWPEQHEAELQWRAKHHRASPTWHFNNDDRAWFLQQKRHVEWRLQYVKMTIPHRDDYSRWEDYLHACGVQVFQDANRPKVHESGHRVLCGLINSFPTQVSQICNDPPVEALPFSAILFGVRPALYLILKNEYLGRGGALTCGNDRCGEFFVSFRAGQRYCSDLCSQQYRQREYWSKTGSKKRNRRRAKLRRRSTTTQHRS